MSMTVGELIAQLQEYDSEQEVKMEGSEFIHDINYVQADIKGTVLLSE